MPSVVDICNLALSHLGDTATVASIDPPEGSAQAEHCARFYPVALGTLLGSHTWGFATKRATLAQLSDADTWAWDYAYAAPSEMLHAIAVLPPGVANGGEPFEVETDADGALLIRTNQGGATLKYVADVTDSTKFPPLFTEALTRLLASYLAGPVVQGESGRKAAAEQLRFMELSLARAKVADSNQQRQENTYSAPWISGR